MVDQVVARADLKTALAKILSVLMNQERRAPVADGGSGSGGTGAKLIGTSVPAKVASGRTGAIQVPANEGAPAPKRVAKKV